VKTADYSLHKRVLPGFNFRGFFFRFMGGSVDLGVDRQKRSSPHFSLPTEKSAKFETGVYSPVDQINLQILMP